MDDDWSSLISGHFLEDPLKISTTELLPFGPSFHGPQVFNEPRKDGMLQFAKGVPGG